MRVKQTKTEKKVEKKIQPLPKTAPIEVYFKDPESIKITLASLSDLSNNAGWKIITSYLNETKKHLTNQLLTLQSPDVMSLSRDFMRIQDQLKYLDYLLSLPQFLIDSYREDVEKSNLDPYYNA
jgi:hypothetical protein